VGANFSIGNGLGFEEFYWVLTRNVEDIGGFLGGEFFVDRDDSLTETLRERDAVTLE
jgi:hypothetical protein